MAGIGAAHARVQARLEDQQKSLLERLRDVPLSQLTIGDLVAIMEWRNCGLKKDYHTNVPWEGDLAWLEQFAQRLGR
jgi:hypothetical protein